VASILEMREEKQGHGGDLLKILAGIGLAAAGIATFNPAAIGAATGVLGTVGAAATEAAPIISGATMAGGGVESALNKDAQYTAATSMGGANVPQHRNIIPALEQMSQRYRLQRGG
jgi:hypothetical protein